MTNVIRAIWIVIGLIVPAVLAWRVLFISPGNRCNVPANRRARRPQPAEARETGCSD